MNALLLVLLAQWGGSTNTNVQPIESRQAGVKLSNTRQFAIDCRTGMTCAVDGGTLLLSSSGGTGGGADPAAPFVAWTTDTTGLTNERVMSAGNYTAIDTGTAGQVQVDWAHGLTCSAGQTLTTSGTTALQCTSTITASDVACAGTCVADAEIAGVSGGKVSGAVASATSATTAGALASNPTDCTAGQYATTIAASGDLTCAQVAFSQVSGTVSNAQLASSYSGVGACGANTWASTLSANAAPTCTQPAFSNLSGTASVAQGGTGAAPGAGDQVFVSDSTSAGTWRAIPDCTDTGGAHLNYTAATNLFSCGTTSSGGGGGAPTTASYITQTPDGTLSAEQALSALSTGIVKVTTGTGVLSTAVASTDYAPATSGTSLLAGNGSGGFSSYAGASCTNQFPRSLSAAGAATCASVSLSADVSGTLGITSGGTGVASRVANDLVVGTGVNTTAAKVLPSCSNATTSKLLYDNATQTFSCGTDQTSGGGSSPGGSTGAVQWNNAAAFAGSTGFETDGADLIFTGSTTHATAPATGKATLRVFEHYGADSPGFPQIITPELGFDTHLNPAPFTRSDDAWWGCVLPATWGSTTLTATGKAAAGGATGTAAAVAWASTDERTRHTWVQYPSATTANATGGYRANVDYMWRGNAAGIGGFLWNGAFNVVTTTANQKLFVGLKDATAVLGTTAVPSATLDAVYFGCDAAQTTIRICSNDNAGSATCTDLGANFPCTTANVAYDVALWSAANGGSIGYWIRRLVNGSEATGTISTDLPRNTVALGWEFWINNGGTAAASTIQFGGTCWWSNP